MRKDVDFFFERGVSMRGIRVVLVAALLLRSSVLFAQEVEKPKEVKKDIVVVLKIDWLKLVKEEMAIQGFQHSMRIAFDKDVRANLGGPFWSDYGHSVLSIPKHWNDGDGFLTDYVGHGIEGAIYGAIFENNLTLSRKVTPGFNKDYRKLIALRAGGIFIFSEWYELGVPSEASIGNLGSGYGRNGLIDHVTTVAVGTLILIGEDVANAKLIPRVRENHPNLANILYVVLNFAHSNANLVGGRYPWNGPPR
jgi:hypothetical protein